METKCLVRVPSMVWRESWGQYTRVERSAGHDWGGEGPQFVAEGRKLGDLVKKVCAVNQQGRGVGFKTPVCL